MKKIFFLCVSGMLLVACDRSTAPDPLIIESPDPNITIDITSPTVGQTVTSPLHLAGKARGYWFFEATAPVVVVDWDGKIIEQGYIQATDNWMTDELVPFEGEISFELSPDTPYRRGAVIFQRDNPSGLPENDDAVEIPVSFE